MVYEIGWIAFLVVPVIVLNFFIQKAVSEKVYGTDSERRILMDSRSSTIDQSVIGMKNVKFNSWEALINKRMKKLRKEEASKIRKMVEYLGLQMISNNMIVPLGSFACLSIYIMSNESASLPSIYTFMLFLTIMFSPIQKLSFAMFMYGSAKISLERINNVSGFEDYEEVEDDGKFEAGFVEISQGSFSWKDPVDFEIEQNQEENAVSATLELINLRVKPGETCYLLGKVGSGKSSLIYSLIDNLYQLNGQVRKNGSVALIPQEPFLLNDTLRNNILFGKVFDSEKYRHVLQICQLESDLDILPAGDMTEIGERGINLSGGQKQRVSIARAVYSDSDIYLVDDCLSALDAHVGKSILKEVFQNYLKEKTMIVATHHYHYIRPQERVILMKQGRIIQDGLLNVVSETDSFREFASKEKKAKTEPDLNQEEEEVVNEDHGEKHRAKENRIKNKKTRKDDDVGKLIKQEDRSYGIVPWGVYLFYLGNGGSLRLALMLLAFSTSAGLDLLVTWWVGKWVESSYPISQQASCMVYFGLILISLIAMLIKYYGFAALCAKSSEKTFNDLFWNILRRPMSFFDTTSSGMIINRCVDDVGKMDFDIPDKICLIAAIIFQVVSTIILTTLIYPLILVFIPPNFFVCYFFIKKYLITSTELKRLNKLSLSPILTSVSELMKGSNSIRLYGYKDTILDKWENGHNRYMRVTAHEASAESWFQMIVNIFLTTNLAFISGFMAISKIMK